MGMKPKIFRKFTLNPAIIPISLALVFGFTPPICTSKSVNSAKILKVSTPTGKSFFPLGFYHVSNRLTAAQRIAALQDIAAAKFNVIHAGCSNLDDYSQFLDEAHRLGIYVITEFDRTNYRQIIERFRDKPAVLAWNIADDAGDHNSKAEILDLHRKIKAIDPRHYTYTSISGWSKKWSEFSDTADLIGSQSYPIGYTLGNQVKGLPNIPIEVNHTFTLARTAASRQNRPFIANVQAFRWDRQRSPTANEVYNMTYQALLAGVKGILFFAYDDGDKNQIRNNPLVWDRLKTLAAEIDRLSPVLTDGSFTKLATNDLELLAGQWKHKNRLYLIVVNTSQSKIISTAIKVPIERGLATALFPDRPTGLKIRNKYLYGLIQPEAVHIYQITQ
jgi:hypothetical protein